MHAIRHLGKPLAVLLSLLPHLALADYLAYSIYEDTRTPLPENIQEVEDRYLTTLSWGTYIGPRTPVAVMPADVSLHSGVRRISDATVPIEDQVHSLVLATLNRSGRFNASRHAPASTNLRSLRGRSGRDANLLQVSLRSEMATDNSSSVNTPGGTISPAMRPCPLISFQLTLFDPVTGEQIARAEGESTAACNERTSPAAASSLLNLDTATANAVAVSLNKAAYSFIRALNTAPAIGSVAAIDNDQFLISLEGVTVERGDLLEVRSRAHPVANSTFGLFESPAETLVGRVEVTDFEPGLVTAKPARLRRPLRIGDRVRTDGARQSLEYAERWTPPNLLQQIRGKFLTKGKYL